MIDWTPYMFQTVTGLHKCSNFVRQVYREQFGIDLSDPDEYADISVESSRHCMVKVDDPREGDVILLRSVPLHVGVVMTPPYFIHSFLCDMPVRSVWTDSAHRNRVMGFYRHRSRA